LSRGEILGDENQLFSVQLIDSGKLVVGLPSSKLFQVPTFLDKIPPLAVSVMLPGIQAQDDLDW
jgi:hypothetical protein